MTVLTPIAIKCVACGTPLSGAREIEGLCPGCLLELALESPSMLAELESLDEGDTLAYSPESLAPGRILGRRYRIHSLLGRGGMGEVWRASDLKLRVEVALKALRRQLLDDPRALETLRQEVRAAREVVSSNVCRVFDLVELDGRELVSMEYIDGITLLDILKMRAPLDLTEAREIASQFLAGLQAIHEAGLVHRDVKPENLMMTRSGRVVLMDFGIAKGLAEGGAGTVSGTPAYMAPEQARGEDLDARADVFSAGAVLAEMIAPGGVRTSKARQEIWHGVHHEPPQIAESPWRSVLGKAVAGQREQRYASAAALARALEEVALRVAGAEDLKPYPGLASFTEEDTQYFFGRELEVEEMWKKLQRPHLLGLIGPSGAGKSSFLRAGLLPVIPTGWRAVVMTPGSRPTRALARALVPELAGNTEALQLLTSSDDAEALLAAVTIWRRQHDEAMLIVDQFEELFTQNPLEVQEQFSQLLSHLALDADVHVLLSMRDDFLGFCSHQESLKPIFSELTPLKPLTGAAVRRALVQPAVKCGYRFEQDALVDEMVGEVGSERGALPMLAFAAARLWDHRDREQGLLTREAYEHIGGVGGALAQHAEATLEKIGEDRISIVRELFRNLVTAQGTRAARDRDELLSVFAEKGGQAPIQDETVPVPLSVLNALIDARLLTSYEVPGEEGEESHHRIEIIHESLLTNWPRLVRWQTQDADSAQLRDQIRQAAQMWEERGRPADLLWTGTSFGEYQLWRDRYEGGLSTAEEEFGHAMVRRAERQKRRRRAAVAVVLAALLAVLAIVTWSRFEAVAEARRAEAARLLALAQLRQEEDPTESLAYTTASLRLADSRDARLFALRVLLEAPPAFGLDIVGTHQRNLKFSPDQQRLAVVGNSEVVAVYSAEGGAPVVLSGHKKSGLGANSAAWISNEILVTGHNTEGLARVWSFPSGELVRQIDVGGPAWFPIEGEDRFFAEVKETDAASGHELYRLRAWQLPEGELEELGVVDLTALGLGFDSWSFIDRRGRGWIYPQGNAVFYRPLPVREGVPDRLIGRHENAPEYGSGASRENRFWTRDAVTSELRLWDLEGSTKQPAKIVGRPAGLESGMEWWPSRVSDRWAMRGLWNTQHVQLWDLDGWSEARPLELRRSGTWLNANATLAPGGDWLVAVFRNGVHLAFWPMDRTWPRIVDGYASYARFVTFSPDGLWLATNWADGSDLLLWPLPGNESRQVRLLTLPEAHLWMNCAFDPRGRYLFVVGAQDRPYVVPLDGSPARRLEGFSDGTLIIAAAVSPSGDQVATAFGQYEGPKTLRVWNLESGELRLYDLPETTTPDTNVGVGKVNHLAFVDEETLYMAGDGGVRRWDLESGTHELVLATKPGYGPTMQLAADGRTALVAEQPLAGDELSSLTLLDLVTGSTRPLPEYGEIPRHVSHNFDIDSSGTLVASGDARGIIRVGRVGGGEPHLLVGHEGRVAVSISPDGRWIASAGEDKTLRLWPMPDLDQPPLHTLPHDELIAKLSSLTNIRVVRDPNSPEDWMVTLDPFPGWKEVPDW